MDPRATTTMSPRARVATRAGPGAPLATRARPRARLATLALCATCLLLAACRRGPRSEPVDVPERAAVHFVVTLELAPGTAATPPPRRRCAVPIQLVEPPMLGAPLEGLYVGLSQVGAAPAEAMTDGEGRATVTGAPGIVQLELDHPGYGLYAHLPVELGCARTELWGTYAVDGEDLDGDGDREEWVLWLEVLPDANGDRLSDTGGRDRWVVGDLETTAWSHYGDGMSSVMRLSSDTFIVESDVLFDDHDGDFVADADDADADGDGLPDGEETEELSCPAFSHVQLAAQSWHATMSCTTCHPTSDPIPYACDDCHGATGRLATDVPLTQPAGHFQRDCEQCHVADRQWRAVPGAGGPPPHLSYLLDGAHLSTSCFGCHVTGNVFGISSVCADCHWADAPPGHSLVDCERCHTTTAWLPTRIASTVVRSVGDGGRSEGRR